MRRTRRLSLLGLAAVSAAAAALTPPVADAASSGPGVWVQLSSGSGVGNIVVPSVHRFGHTLQVLWTQQVSSSAQQLMSRILNPGGSPATGVIGVLPGWASLDEFASVLSNNGQRVIVFSGIQDTNSSNPYSQGWNYYATSGDGVSWTLANGTVSSSKSAYASYGSDAVDAAGTVVAGFTAATASDVSFHTGLDSMPPANADGTTTPNPQCCAYDTGAGYDASTGQTWLAWYSNSGAAATEGVNAERILPSLGTLVHAPASSTTYAGSPSSIEPEQRVQVAPRAGGGLYAAYGIGYPTQTKVALWRLGSSSPIVVNVRHAIAFPGVATGPGGRLWLFWYLRGTNTLQAVRTNAAATRIGQICSLHTPHSTTSVWKTAGDGANGLLDLVVNAGTGTGEQISSTQVRPCLSASVSPTSIRSSRGGTVTVKITDAGAAVSHATVRYGRTTKTTGSAGTVRFTVARGTSKGRKTITFGRSGYTGGKVTFRVT